MASGPGSWAAKKKVFHVWPFELELKVPKRKKAIFDLQQLSVTSWTGLAFEADKQTTQDQ